MFNGYVKLPEGNHFRICICYVVTIHLPLVKLKRRTCSLLAGTISLWPDLTQNPATLLGMSYFFGVAQNCQTMHPPKLEGKPGRFRESTLTEVA